MDDECESMQPTGAQTRFRETLPRVQIRANLSWIFLGSFLDLGSLVSLTRCMHMQQTNYKLNIWWRAPEHKQAGGADVP